MTTDFSASFPRRRFMAMTGLGAAALALPACTTGAPSLTEAIRRLLLLSSDRAFARLLAPGGFYENGLAGLNLEDVFGTRGGILQTILTSGVVRDRLARRLGDVAAIGAERAAPAIADTIRIVGVGNAVALITGDPTAATSFLRGNMGARLIDVMLPEIGDAMRVIDDPVIGPAFSALSGVDLSGVARNFTGRVEDVIWTEMGREEAAIRADPRETGDPLLIGVFGTR